MMVAFTLFIRKVFKMRLNIREIKRVGSLGAKVTVNIMRDTGIYQKEVNSSDCIKLIEESESYDCRKDAFSSLVIATKLYNQISKDVSSGKCELY